MRLVKSLKKILSVIATTAVIFNSVAPSLLVLAQETTTPEPTPIESPVASPEATPEITDAPTESPTAAPDAIITPAAEATVEPAPVETQTPSPDETQPETQNTTDENAQSQAPPSESPSLSPTPTVTPVQPEEEGILTTTVVETTLFSDTLEENNWFNLITDKLDYAPTEAAIITGTNFTPGETYILTVSSTDDPATSTTVSVTADSNGSFTYVYQLDGIYRPDYLVQVFSGSTLIASTTFTDSPTKITAKEHQGQKSDNTYTAGNITEYSEGDTINFRLTLESTHGPTSNGRLEIRYTGDDGTCTFFD